MLRLPWLPGGKLENYHTPLPTICLIIQFNARNQTLPLYTLLWKEVSMTIYHTPPLSEPYSTHLHSQSNIPHPSTLRAIFHTPPLSEPYSTHLHSQSHIPHTSTLRAIFHIPPLSEPYSTHFQSQNHIPHTSTLKAIYGDTHCTNSTLIGGRRRK